MLGCIYILYSGYYFVTHNSVTHPGVRNASAGVLKGRQQADSQVMSQVKQLIIVTFKAHLAKRMFWVSQQDVSWDKASQDPSEKKKILHCDAKQRQIWIFWLISGYIILDFKLSILL